MKNFIFLLITMFAVLTVNAQVNKTISFGVEQTAYEQTMLISDSLSTDATSTDSVMNYTVNVNKAYPVKYDSQIELDSLNGTPAVDIFLEGYVFENDTPTRLDTITWSGTTSDTTILFQDRDTARYYRTLKYVVQSRASGGAFYVSKVSTKIWSK